MTLFINLCLIKPFGPTLLKMLFERLEQTALGQTPLRQAEVYLNMYYNLF